MQPHDYFLFGVATGALLLAGLVFLFGCWAGLKPEPPTCADTGSPKHPGNCWNVRCQLGNRCCRADGVKGDGDGR